MSEPAKLAEHQNALSAYLQDMLLDVPSENTLNIKQQLADNKSQTNTLEKNKWLENVIFQALIVDIHGMKFAIPLNDLHNIIRWSQKELTEITSKPTWHLGLLSKQHQQSIIIDTAHILIPSQYQSIDSSYHFILLIAEGKWGLSCNNIIEIVTLSPNEIRWTKQHGTRPWLAGTVLDKMYSILNIEELTQQLES